MSSRISDIETVVLELFNQTGELIGSVTNDDNKQLRIVFNDSNGDRTMFESDIESVVSSLDGKYTVDFIDLDDEYIAIISLD